MLRVGRKVVYPVYGAGKIKKRYKPRGEDKEYYKVDFYDSKTTISLPVEDAEDLGLRPLLSKKKLKKRLKKLDSKKKIKKKDMKNVKEEAQELFDSGRMKDAVETLQRMRAAKRLKDEEGKSLGIRDKTLLDDARSFIASEVRAVLGESQVEEYL